MIESRYRLFGYKLFWHRGASPALMLGNVLNMLAAFNKTVRSLIPTSNQKQSSSVCVAKTTWKLERSTELGFRAGLRLETTHTRAQTWKITQLLQEVRTDACLGDHSDTESRKDCGVTGSTSKDDWSWACSYQENLCCLLPHQSLVPRYSYF